MLYRPDLTDANDGTRITAIMLIREAQSHRTAGLKHQLRLCGEAASLLKAEVVAEIMLGADMELRAEAPSPTKFWTDWFGRVDFLIAPQVEVLGPNYDNVRSWIDNWNHRQEAPQVVIADQLIEHIQANELTPSERKWLGLIPAVTLEHLEEEIALFEKANPNVKIHFQVKHRDAS